MKKTTSKSTSSSLKRSTCISGLTSIVLPIHNTDYPPAHYTGNCIGCIKYFTDKNRTPYELIVIDQASTVELGGLIWKDVVDVYKKFKDNKGYTGGMNRGIELAKGEFICLMSSDVEVYEHWLEDMQDALNRVDLVMSTPMYDAPYGRATEARKRREKWIKNDNEHQWLRDFRDFSCVLTTRKVFDKIGLFDEKLGSYSEDVDFVLRIEKEGMTAKSSKRVATHHIGMATGHTMQMQGFKLGDQMNKNKEYLQKKWNFDEFGVAEFKRKKNEKV